MASVSSVSFSKDLFGKVDEAGEGEDGDSDKDEEETKLFVSLYNMYKPNNLLYVTPFDVR